MKQAPLIPLRDIGALFFMQQGPLQIPVMTDHAVAILNTLRGSIPEASFETVPSRSPWHARESSKVRFAPSVEVGSFAVSVYPPPIQRPTTARPTHWKFGAAELLSLEAFITLCVTNDFGFPQEIEWRRL